MAVTGYTRRRVNLYSLSSSTPDGVGPYEDVFVSLAKRAPFEATGAFERKIRVNYLEKFDNFYFVEFYLILNKLEVLEISSDPDGGDKPSFVVPADKKRFCRENMRCF